MLLPRAGAEITCSETSVLSVVKLYLAPKGTRGPTARNSNIIARDGRKTACAH